MITYKIEVYNFLPYSLWNKLLWKDLMWTNDHRLSWRWHTVSMRVVETWFLLKVYCGFCGRNVSLSYFLSYHQLTVHLLKKEVLPALGGPSNTTLLSRGILVKQPIICLKKFQTLIYETLARLLASVIDESSQRKLPLLVLENYENQWKWGRQIQWSPQKSKESWNTRCGQAC